MEFQTFHNFSDGGSTAVKGSEDRIGHQTENHQEVGLLGSY
jgi:hypothetical protein